MEPTPAESAEVPSNSHVKSELEVVDIVSSGDESASSDSDESTSSSSDGIEEEVKQPARFAPPIAPPGFVMYQHRKLRTLHLMPAHREKIFMCGRTKGPLHSSDNLNPRYDTPICYRCFTSAKQT